MNRLAATAALMVSSCAVALRAEPPSLTQVTPMGVTPGAKLTVSVGGENLGDTKSLWTNLPGAKSTLKPPKEDAKPTAASLELQVPEAAPLGVYGVRVATGQGVSNLWLLMVDDLPTVREVKQHNTRETAQELQLPVAVEGSTETEAYDFYKFHAAAGQRVSFEVVARRLGSPLDSVVRLLDEQGHELVFSDDDPALGADGRFVHRFAAEGDYWLELRDVRYQGGSGYRYRLRIGDFPLATVTWPMAGCVNSTARLVVAGRELDKLPPVDLPIASGSADETIPLAVRYPKGHGSTVVQVLRGGLEQVEFEPNDQAEQATAIELRGAINGRFEKPGDRDYYTFEADAKQRMVLIGQTRQVGAPTDLYLRLYDDKGNQLAEVDDDAGEEAALDHTFAAKGTYRLLVEDLLNTAGPDRLYRIECRASREPFTLAADADRYNAPHGGVLAVKVTTKRRATKGPIELQVAGDTAGWKVSKEIIPAGKNDTTLLIELPRDLAQGTYRSFTIVGRAKDDKEPQAVAATCLVALRAQLNGLAYPPAELCKEVMVGVGPEFPAFFALEGPKAAVPFAQRSGKVELVVKAKRMNKFDDAITLAVEGLPEGFKAGKAEIAKGKTEATIEITAPKNVALMKSKVRVVGSAAFQNQPGSSAVDATLEVVPAK
ncbi:MAG TPA: hypothetical protein VHZ24_06925 [Pirellulales bacterium]|jgi:hypothetical protein|nr:hypothetical protein [Pirellulales bacterium]